MIVSTLDLLGLKPVKQTVLGRGPTHNEPCGNCMQAALATALGLPLEAVPHFLKDGSDDGWWERMNEWLVRNFQVSLISLKVGDWDIPPVVHLMQGKTVRDSEHVVVGYAGQMIHDPHPSNAGLSEVDHIEVFVACYPGER